MTVLGLILSRGVGRGVIEGVRVGKDDLIISHADDTILFLSADQHYTFLL